MPLDLGFSASDSARQRANEQVTQARSPLETALWCAARGWPVHPLAAGRKTPASNCRHCPPGSHPPHDCACIADGRWCHGFHAATTDPAVITAWWQQQPRFGVGVACGPAGLIVIDVDAHLAPLPERDRLLPGIPIPESVSLHGLQHGFHSLALLAAMRGQDDPVKDTNTLRVRTPSGGMHLWYLAREQDAWRCSAGSSTGRALAWQVDVRAHGGYIIAPGTTTAAGTYTPCTPAAMPAPLPNWLAAELARTGHRPAVPTARATTPVPSRGRAAVIAAGGGRDAAAKALTTVLTAVADCASAPEGTGFTDKLNRAAFTAGGLVGAGRMTQADAEAALLAAATHARPGQERRSLQIIRSGMNAGSRRPLNPGDRT
ncbi:bifunctional DNA primase/polymerase (plasmid) [Streptomyces sp. NBC_01558]|uniref:bifunctional DNA primase/polymerase n=1 Tax=Streptomyces sp. NBC_01558 TaxID=2975878 RepID=UPI002DDC5759|nr:bifunctional DNA primase/polymerase [Streptomyces sp. NBC_01558]WSD82754.1 bifunctional DNA primase/polymerase [Streptomyces sp. NBC_01558]